MKHAPWCVLATAALLVGCASNPEQAVFVMPAPTGFGAGQLQAPSSLALELRPVILPDYLDTTDLVTRTGQYDIAASRTGRWGERLSLGVTRSLADDLCHRLRAYVVSDGPAVQIEVTVSAFDVTAATSVLAASWTVVWPGGGRLPVIGHGKFTSSVGQPGGDLAVVAAMAETVAELSDGIAATTLADEAGGLRLEARASAR
jgi:uncharacterized lipoprotein YmbA